MPGGKPFKPPPNWNVWAKCVVAPLTKAVALSCDLDPDAPAVAFGCKVMLRKLGGSDYSDIDGVFGVTLPPYSVYDSPLPENDAQKLDERLAVAANNVNGGMLKTTYGTLDGQVRFEDFVRFAEQVGWNDLPAQFPTLKMTRAGTLESSTVAVVATSEKALGNRERGHLLAVIAALAQRQKIDWRKRRVAGDAIEKIVKEQLGKKISSRAIQNYLRSAEDLIDRRADDAEGDGDTDDDPV